MIYTTGTIAISGNTLTGTGTNFTAAGSLIRNGCTVIALTSPVQVFQITAVGSATSLTVTPAANPAVPSGTKYAILLSDSLSVDGLAQDIAETFTMYQRYMSGFADVMNGTTDVTITINGAAVTVPGQKSLAKKGANNDITSLSGLTTALSIEQGGTGAKDTSGALANFGIKTAAMRDVGTGHNQIPDMGGFSVSLGVNGWAKLPNGLIFQWGCAGPLTPQNPDAIANFNITFPNKCLFITEHDQGNAARKTEVQIGYLTNTAFTLYNLGILDRTAPTGLQPPITAYVLWFAIGY